MVKYSKSEVAAMTIDQLKLQRLANQHLLQKTDTRRAVRDLCGVQAQFMGHALHGLSLRSDADPAHLVKTWTLRGTMHLIDEGDLPLFLHEGRSPFLRPQDTLSSDAWVSGSRKSFFVDLILSALASGSKTREELKRLCRSKGMTDSEEASLFDPWGGIIRALCEDGSICHLVSQEKAYRLCPEFFPMDTDSAHLELARRYFTHFGPATVKDAAYFLGWTQKEVKQQLSRLNVDTFPLENQIFYHIAQEQPSAECPPVLFLAGFDQLMLGYEKKESLFLPPNHLRDIFTLSGIVRPALLVEGTVSGSWNLKNNKLTVRLFHAVDHSLLTEAAQQQWPALKKIEFV